MERREQPGSGPGSRSLAGTGTGSEVRDTVTVTELPLFDHERLEVYRVAREFLVLETELLKRKVPPRASGPVRPSEHEHPLQYRRGRGKDGEGGQAALVRDRPRKHDRGRHTARCVEHPWGSSPLNSTDRRGPSWSESLRCSVDSVVAPVPREPTPTPSPPANATPTPNPALNDGATPRLQSGTALLGDSRGGPRVPTSTPPSRRRKSLPTPRFYRYGPKVARSGGIGPI